MVRRLIPLVLLVASPALAQQGGLPEGWTGRADRGDASGIMFSSMGSGFHLSPGRSGIVYRAADRTGDKFHAEVTFNQTKAPEHPEAYGVFMGGSDLDGAAQKYVYFLVRGDGMYTVKQRDGAEAPTLVPWTASDAIVKQDADGKATNRVEIDATGAKVAFKVNGKVVYETADVTRSGFVGLRLNHGLDVHIAGFAVHKM